MKITMNLGVNSYDIFVKRSCLSDVNKFLKLDRNVLIVTDNGVPSEYSQTVAKFSKNPVIVTLEQGEETKSFENIQKLCSLMLKNGFTRNDCVVAVGGGVIGDLAGFAAACFMRGIDFYNIPTTLLSQVDSSIGGKVAINFEGIKNIVGAFYQPKCVVIDPDVLKTLPERHISNGLAEAVKMGLTSDNNLFELFEKGDISNNIEDIIIRSLSVKKKVVECDEKEKGLRKILNFGHTIGHAIESNKFGELYHGECVALGMIYMCSKTVKERLIPVLNKLNLPTKTDFNKNDVISALLHDKKTNNDTISVIYVNEVGSFIIEEKTVNEIAELI